MTTLEFCRKHVVFTRAGSPIIGPFRDEYYPFLREVFAASDDITCKRLVFLKASSSMGTVALQCMLAKRVSLDAGDILFVAQSDDDAAKFSKTRGKQFMADIGYTSRLLSREKYSVTNNLWLYRGKFVAIEGPGENNQNSQQTATVFTDESHTEAYLPGTLAAFEKRAGGKWNRKIIHATTAANIDKEITGFYFEGDQSEWNLRCPKCAKLIDPIFSDADALDAKYNGAPVFVFSESSVSPTLICPHCNHESRDTSRDRFLLNRDGGYVMANAEASRATRSFRWPVWAMHSISWDGLLAEYRASIVSAKMGNLAPHEDWVKKRECRPYVPMLPDFGDGKGSNDYKLGDVWECGESERFMGIDRQAGKGDEGEHLWCLVVQYDRQGNSRRLSYSKVQTFAQAEVIANLFAVKPQHVYCDSGYENRSTFRECGKRHWFTVRGSDETGFLHIKKMGKEMRSFEMPYSQGELQSGVIGQKPDKAIRVKGPRVPPGWAWQFVQANPTLYSTLTADIGGLSGRYFGIASDMPDEYRKNIPAFIMVTEKDKFGRDKKPVWKPVRETHPHDCEIAARVGAIRAGFYPLAGAFNSASDTSPKHDGTIRVDIAP